MDVPRIMRGRLCTPGGRHAKKAPKTRGSLRGRGRTRHPGEEVRVRGLLSGGESARDAIACIRWVGTRRAEKVAGAGKNFSPKFLYADLMIDPARPQGLGAGRFSRREKEFLRLIRGQELPIRCHPFSFSGLRPSSPPYPRRLPGAPRVWRRRTCVR